MRVFPAVLGFYIIIKYVHSNPITRKLLQYFSTDELYSSSDISSRFRRSADELEVHKNDPSTPTVKWKMVMFIFLYGLLIMLAVIACFLWKLYKSRREEPAENSTGSETNQNQIVIKKNDSTETIHFFKDVESTVGDENEETEKIDCPEELLTCPINERIDYLHFDKSFEIDKANLLFSTVLGKGNFGVVHQGKLKMANPKNEDDRNKKLNVAIKSCLHSFDQQMIYDELKVMCAIGKHPNILALVGAITTSREKKIVTEFIECGDLLQFLRNRKESFEDQPIDENGYLQPLSVIRKTYSYGKEDGEKAVIRLCTFDLLSFAYQIANGMRYLSTIPCVHRDLALRNVLIKENKIIRIADFGLTRRHIDKDYYRMRDVESHPLPIYYLPPECFNVLKPKFTEKSDVWSFGVCLYEIFSLGETPYRGVGDMAEYLKSGKRLEKPLHCDPKVYDFMRLCWNQDPIVRPTFEMCMQFFEDYLKKSANKLLVQIESNLKLEAEEQKRLDIWIRKGNN